MIARRKMNPKTERMEQTKFEKQIRAKYGDDIEVRTMELRAADEPMVLEGYAAKFDDITDLGFFQERIAVGAFDDVLGDDVRYLLNHDGMPLARTQNGTLELTVDEVGLKTRAVLNDTQQSRDVYAAVKRGDISQMSFAFTIANQEVDEERNLRTVTRMKRLYDVSPVTYPAYPTTTLEARSLFAAKAATEQETTQERQEIDSKPKDTTETPETASNAAKTVKSERRNLATNKQKPMNINDLKGQRAAYYEEFVELGQKAEAEGRSMTEAEQERADKLDGLIQDIDQKIRHKKREQEMIERAASVNHGLSSDSEQKEVKATNYRFSLSRAINTLANGKNLEGAEAEWAQESAREMRGMGLQPQGRMGIPSIALRAGSADDFQATPTGDGSGFVPTAVPQAIEALRAPSVIQTLGAQVINASGNLKFPRVSVPGTATQIGEVTASTGAGMELDEVNLTPNRISTHTMYSQQLILQGGPQVDALIANDLRAEFAEIIDRKAFAAILADSDVDDQSTAGATDTTFTASVALAMEAAILAAGGDLSGASYVMSPTAYKLSKQLAQVSGVSALFENGQFNGYRPVATKHLLDETAGSVGQMVFGNFRQGLILAFFSGVDILVDPYTNAKTGQIELHVNRYYDVAVRQPGALSICTDLVSA